MADAREFHYDRESRQPTRENPLHERIFQTVPRIVNVFNAANPGNIDLPMYVAADIKYENLRERGRITQDIYDHMDQMEKNANDHAGHLIAASLGGPTVPENFIPMASRVNSNGFWWQTENELRTFLSNNRSGKVSWEMIIVYLDDPKSVIPKSYRPIGFCLRYKLFYNNQQRITEPEVKCFRNEDEESRNQNYTFGFTDFYMPM